MNLVEVLLPRPEDFWVYTKNKLKVHIMGYNHINIDFLHHISYINGDKHITKNPTIIYTVYMDDYNKSQLFSLFKEEFRDIYQTKDCYIGIKSRTKKEDNEDSKDDKEYEEYVFKGRISAIPSFLKAATNQSIIPTLKQIKISLSLDNVGIDALYEEFTETYRKYYKNNEISRFELMEI